MNPLYTVNIKLIAAFEQFPKRGSMIKFFIVKCFKPLKIHYT